MHDVDLRIAVIAPNWLGDAVMSLPLVGLLSASGAVVSVIAPPYTARVFHGVKGIDELVVTSGQGRLQRIRESARALRSIDAGAVVVLPPSFSSALAARLGGAGVCFGLATDGRGALLTGHVREDRSVHLSEGYVALGERALSRLGVTAARNRRPPDMRVFPEDESARDAVLTRHNVSGAYAVVVPGAEYGPAKSWPAARFRALVSEMSRDVPVLLTGVDRERELCDHICAGLSGVHNVAGETDTGGFFALVRDASVVIANDSGSPHAAASLGAPVVVLFGSTSPKWTRPMGNCVEVIQHVVHCNPCFRRECPTELECFNGIEPSEVLRAARGMIEASEKEVASSRRGR